MEENWYAVEQQIRDRLTEARARARTWTMTQGPTPAARRPHAVGITIILLGSWVWARAVQLPLELSRGFASVRAAMKDTASHRRDSSKVADSNT